jgi:hypothetical protein
LADVSPEKADFMANSQVPWGVAAAQRLMAKRANATVAEAKGSHAIYVSQPKAVAELIEKAAMSLSTK